MLSLKTGRICRNGKQSSKSLHSPETDLFDSNSSDCPLYDDLKRRHTEVTRRVAISHVFLTQSFLHVEFRAVFPHLICYPPILRKLRSPMRGTSPRRRGSAGESSDACCFGVAGSASVRAKFHYMAGRHDCLGRRLSRLSLCIANHDRKYSPGAEIDIQVGRTG